VNSPIQRDPEARRYRIEPVGAELLLGAINRARTAGLVTGSRTADA
jgi:hypothetical protein